MRGVGRAPDPYGLVAGLTVTALGALLLLDQAGALELTLGWLGVALAGALGVILLTSGLLGERRAGPGDDE